MELIMDSMTAYELEGAVPAAGAPAADAGMTPRDILGEICTPRCILVIGNLEAGPMRFTELKRAIDGISQRMLTLTLRGLERDGLVSRTVEPTVPPKVTYALTELGTSLREPVKALGDWAIAHIACIRAAQQRFDARQG